MAAVTDLTGRTARRRVTATGTSVQQDCGTAGDIQTGDAAAALPTEAPAPSDRSNTPSAGTTAAVSAVKGASSGSPSSLSNETVSYQGSGLVFNNTYGSGVSVTFQNKIVAAESYLQSIFTNACTVNCTFDLQALDPKYSGENTLRPASLGRIAAKGTPTSCSMATNPVLSACVQSAATRSCTVPRTPAIRPRSTRS